LLGGLLRVCHKGVFSSVVDPEVICTSCAALNETRHPPVVVPRALHMCAVIDGRLGKQNLDSSPPGLWLQVKSWAGFFSSPNSHDAARPGGWLSRTLVMWQKFIRGCSVVSTNGKTKQNVSLNCPHYPSIPRTGFHLRGSGVGGGSHFGHE
jgi:hypothetical protein